MDTLARIASPLSGSDDEASVPQGATRFFANVQPRLLTFRLRKRLKYGAPVKASAQPVWRRR